MSEKKNFMNANDIAEYMDISVSLAYKLIHKLNAELDEQGYITVSGKVNRGYFETRIGNFM